MYPVLDRPMRAFTAEKAKNSLCLSKRTTGRVETDGEHPDAIAVHSRSQRSSNSAAWHSVSGSVGFVPDYSMTFSILVEFYP